MTDKLRAPVNVHEACTALERFGNLVKNTADAPTPKSVKDAVERLKAIGNDIITTAQDWRKETPKTLTLYYPEDGGLIVVRPDGQRYMVDENEDNDQFVVTPAGKSFGHTWFDHLEEALGWIRGQPDLPKKGDSA